MAELDRCGDPELGEARQVFGREQLRVLDAVAQAERLPRGARLLEGVECLPVREIADRVDGDRQPRRGAAADDLRELFLARDLHAAAVEHARCLRAERPVHERLQVADAHEVVAEAAREVQGLEVAHLFGRDRLPDPEVQ